MNAALLEEVVEAVLYEGYILYPYRPSARKNARERFSFGRVYPEAYSKAQGGVEPCVMQTECLCKAGESARVEVSVRFLHPIARQVGVLPAPCAQIPAGAENECARVPELRVGDRLFQAWHEASERKILAPALSNGNEAVELKLPFRFSAWRELEPIRNEQQLVVGVVLRRQEAVEGTVELALQPLGNGLSKVTVRILNQTGASDFELEDREAIALRTFASTHTILTVEGGEFISLMDPPVEWKEAAAGCRNAGTWPVLVGEESRGERDAVLSSPIILYDYPKIASESAGPMFDGTEIDEILTLRIATLTEGEKSEMRQADEHARRLLERTEGLSGDSFLGMHGVMRRPPAEAVEFDDFFGPNTRLQGVSVGGVYVRAGDRVRLCPKARADVMDLALSGQTAIIEAVEQDLEKRIYLAVVLENDPGKDLGLLRQPGHRFFYGIDEVEPLGVEAL